MSDFPDIERLTDDESLAHYGRDWTRFWTPAPQAVVFPRSTDDVANLVGWARSEKAALVPSGGRTGLSGGAVAPGGEVVVSFDKMRAIKGLGLDLLVNVDWGAISKAGGNITGFELPDGLIFDERLQTLKFTRECAVCWRKELVPT